MRLEVRFFSAVPASPARPCVGLLVVDFDETLTEADTTPRIIAAAVAAAEAGASGAAGCLPCGYPVVQWIRELPGAIASSSCFSD